MLDNFLSGVASLPALKTSSSGVFTNTQMNEYMQSLLGDVSLLKENTAVQGEMFSTDALTGGIAVPKGANVNKGVAVAGYANTSAISFDRTVGNAVGGYFQCRNLAGKSACWGINQLVQDSSSVTGHNMTGDELDMNLYGSPIFFKGYYLTGLNGGGTLPATATGFEVSTPYQLPIGFICDRGSCKVGAQFHDVSSNSPSASQSLQFISHNTAGTTFIGTLYQDANGNLHLNSASGQAVELTNLIATAISTASLSQASASQYAGTSACSGNTQTISLPVKYSSQPVILVFDETTAGGVKLTARSTSGFTVSCAGSTDAFDWIVVGNPQ